MLRKWILGLMLATFFLAACGVAFPRNPPMFGGRNPFGKYGSNGERIYFTGTNEKDERIAYTGGSSGGMMMGGGQLACVSCHGADRRGGTHTMHMEVMDAPDIRFAALSGETVAGEHSDAEHAEVHAGKYTLETFRQAVVEGQHPNGEALSRDMPRWELDEDDLADLFDFLKTLP